MQPFEEIEKQLWEYADNTCSDAERSRIAHLIATSDVWKKLHEEVMVTHKLLHALETGQPSMRFSKNVMEAIATTAIAPRTNKYINHRLIQGTLIFLTTTIVSLLVYIIALIDWSAAVPAPYTSSVHKVVGNPAIQYMGIFICIITALAFIDSILRKRSFQNHTTPL